MIAAPAIDRRVLVVAPTGGDARNTILVLEHAGLQAEACDNVAVASEEAGRGCGLFLIAEEALRSTHRLVLRTALAKQPKWSNIPVVLITSGGKAGSRNVREDFAPQTHVTLLERPLRTVTLVAAVEAALSSRDQQYEIRDLLEEREKWLSSLEVRVNERTAKLQSMVEEMEAFSYSVSHDLRAPLRVLAGYAQAVREDYAENLPPQGHNLLEKISNAAVRMDRLTQDLLAYTRVANGELATEPLDLDEIVRDVIEGYPTLLEARKFIRLRRPLGRCQGHAPSLAQCFSNLLENAVKFARPNMPPEIEVFSEPHGDRLRVTVADKGVGIEPHHHERIFGLFERANGHAPGTGIGLAIVKKAALRMNGTVGIKPHNTNRTEFWIELERAKPQ
jgi:signal transduction histidine kinase